MTLQRTPEWYAARLGKCTASRLNDVMATLQNGKPAASRANYCGQLVAERLSGRVRNGYVSPAMQQGMDTEPEARLAYAFFLARNR